MTIEEVIKKAIEGGWDDTNYAFASKDKGDGWLVDDWQYDEKIFLDPKFWQSFGIVMGWENFVDAFGNDVESAEATGYRMYQQWVCHWHKFIDHLAEGKTAEDYFKSL